MPEPKGRTIVGRTFRVFVSSTFSDLVAERNELQAVFERLRSFCEDRGCRFQAIDLRWGINEEAQLDQQTMNICLRELKRSKEISPRPNFLVVLGDRYGWEPLPSQIPAPEFEQLMGALGSDEAKRIVFDEMKSDRLQGQGNGWFRLDRNALPNGEYVLLPRLKGSKFEVPKNWAEEESELLGLLRRAAKEVFGNSLDPQKYKYFQSATHQEVEAGALAVAEASEHTHAYFRQSSTNLDQCPSSGKLSALKDLIRERLPENHVHRFTQPEELARQIEENLRRIIDQELDKLESVSTLTKEVTDHQQFATGQSLHFAGRSNELRIIREYLEGDVTHPLFLYGESGSGKTAIMAKASLQDRRSDAPLAAQRLSIAVARFIGTTPGSSNLRYLLETIGTEIDSEFGVESSSAPRDFKKLIEWFEERLAQATVERPITLIVDALDELGEIDRAHHLKWLPRKLPPHVRIVVSILDRSSSPESALLEGARREFPMSTFIAIEPLSSDDASALLTDWLSSTGRTLRDQQFGAILERYRYTDGLPLWLKLAFEEARQWRSFDSPVALPGPIPDLIRRKLDLLTDSEHHDRLLVERSLGYLASSRYGLSEEELLDVLALDEEYWSSLAKGAHSQAHLASRRLPTILWARFYADVGGYLTEQLVDGTVLLGLFHRLFRETVEDAFLLDRTSVHYHRSLASYFDSQPLERVAAGKPTPNSRKLTETPFQHIRGECWTSLLGDSGNSGLLTRDDFIQAKCNIGYGPELAHEIQEMVTEQLPASYFDETGLLYFAPVTSSSSKLNMDLFSVYFGFSRGPNSPAHELLFPKRFEFLSEGKKTPTTVLSLHISGESFTGIGDDHLSELRDQLQFLVGSFAIFLEIESEAIEERSGSEMVLDQIYHLERSMRWRDRTERSNNPIAVLLRQTFGPPTAPKTLPTLPILSEEDWKEIDRSSAIIRNVLLSYGSRVVAQSQIFGDTSYFVISADGSSQVPAVFQSNPKEFDEVRAVPIEIPILWALRKTKLL